MKRLTAYSVAAIGLTLMLSGCESWFGESEADPLPGDRISVLLHERNINSDPDLAGLEVTLPRPWRNPEWPQAGDLQTCKVRV